MTVVGLGRKKGDTRRRDYLRRMVQLEPCVD
jgi:hypothetical protein